MFCYGLRLRHNNYKLTLVRCYTNHSRKLRKTPQADIEVLKRLEFRQEVKRRKEQADRCVLIDAGPNAPEYAIQFMNTFLKEGLSISSWHPYQKGQILVELENNEQVNILLSRHAKFVSEATHMPMPSRSLYMHVPGSVRDNNQAKEIETNHDTMTFQLAHAKSMNEQMQILERIGGMSEVDIRVRYFVMSEAEQFTRRLFPWVACTPFGSSVNGLGNARTDIDISLNFSVLSNSPSNGRQLIYKSKKMADSRMTWPKQALGLLADALIRISPQFSHVTRILNARVPILKMLHTSLNIECDLSYENPGGCEFSEILFMFVNLEPRLLTLAHTVRHWATARRICREFAGAYVTNFQLLCLLIFFMQSRCSPPLLPPLTQIVASSNVRQTPSGHLVRELKFDPLKILDWRANTPVSKETPADLLLGFFEFYSTVLKFNTDALCLDSGRIKNKRSAHCIEIPNPLELDHNIGRNVNRGELTKLMEAFGSAFWDLEKGSNPDPSSNWGLLKLLEPVKDKPIHKLSSTDFEVFDKLGFERM